MWRLLHTKKLEKVLNGQGCRTGRDGRMYGWTYESEFLGSFSSLKTSAEPKKGSQLVLKTCSFFRS